MPNYNTTTLPNPLSGKGVLNADEPGTFFYDTDDSLNTILTTGYFDEFSVPDESLIKLVCADGVYEVQVVGGVASVLPSQKYASDDINLNIAKLLATDLQPTWDRSQFDTAIASGSCTVTFVGTSITVGTAENENSNTWVNRFKRYMEYKYPSVDFSWYNMSLGGRSLNNYNDTNYLGLAEDPSDIADGYYVAANPDTWPDGSTVGQSWQDAVQATAPDLLIIAHGQNNRDVPYVMSNYYTTAITDAQSWTTAPSIALVSEMLPYSDSTGLEDIRRISDFTRCYAATLGYGLIDVGRAWQAARYNVDPAKTVAKRQSSISDWEQSGAIGILTDNSFDVDGSTNGTISKRDKSYAGVRFYFEFVPDNNQADFYLQAHVLDETPDDGCIHIERIGINLRIKKRPSAGDEIAWTTAVPTIGVREYWDIRINKHLIEIYRDGLLVGKHKMEHTNGNGTINFTLNTAMAENIVVDLEENVKPFASELTTDGFLLGGPEQGDWQNGDYSVGGNSLNHPSRLAVANVFDPVIRDWVAKL